MPAMRADLAEAASLTRVPLGIRNGSWDDATLDPAGGRISSINNAGCHACHARAEAWQDTFSYPQLALAAQTSEPQHGAGDRFGCQPCTVPGP